jgi:hypothetical protein
MMDFNRLINLIFLLLVRQIFAQSPPAASITAQAEKRFISKVSQVNLRMTVRDIVQCGNRLGGTVSGDKSVKYVVRRLKGYGFDPEIVSEPEQLAFSDVHWNIRIEEPNRLRGLIQHEWLAGYSPSVREQRSSLISCLSDTDLDKKKIDGKAVLLDRHPSDQTYKVLVQAGARCLLTYEPVHSSAYSIYAMITNLKASKTNPIPVYDISTYAGERLKSELQKGIPVTIKYSSKCIVAPGHPKTVIATLHGTGDGYFIVCAHGDSDSGGPGADDNASGVSGVMEIARLLKGLVDDQVLPPPSKSIRFIVWGSEVSSSGYYVRQHAQELQKIAGVINLDEIGIARPRNCIYFEGNDAEQNHDLLKIFENIGEKYAGQRGFWKEATTNPLLGGLDSHVFLPKSLEGLGLPSVGIPSITIFTAAWNEPKTVAQTEGWRSKAWKGKSDSIVIGYSPYYHSALDLPKMTTDKEPVDMVWGVNAAGLALLQLMWK